MSKPLYTGPNHPNKTCAPGRSPLNKSIYDGVSKTSKKDWGHHAAAGSNVQQPIVKDLTSNVRQQGSMKRPLKSYTPGKIW
jgi:hypothetical protein